jgi:hypothetical protein
MNTYKATSEYGLAIYGEGDFDLDLSAAEERDLLLAGHLEIVPRAYLSTSRRYEVPQGETFEAAMLVEQEAMLVAGGHIARVEEPAQETAAVVAEKANPRKKRS